MADFHVQIHKLASRDLDQIAAWIAGRSVDGAQRWMAAFVSVLESIRRSPKSCSSAPENLTKVGPVPSTVSAAPRPPSLSPRPSPLLRLR